ncbi:ABC transporter permease [Catenovulum sediminis]|uniref:ABC transporter permease n=1 Tax=Catenovulum sediminis TaxID=1740262 RepID=UPI00163D6BBC|nr:FtsX-like permease family protein [Catenovulum sediminis]
MSYPKKQRLEKSQPKTTDVSMLPENYVTDKQWIVSLRLAARLLKQELKRGELSIMLAALVLAVSSVFSLSMFSERLQAALQNQSAEFLAADSVLTSSREVPESWFIQAQSNGLKTSAQIRFSSMLFANNQMHLTSVRAVDQFYPLRGQIELTDTAWTGGQPTALSVKPGEIWLDSKLVSQLGVDFGDMVEVGLKQLKFTQLIASVPDADLNVFNAGALALMHIQDVAATQVIQPGSRIAYLLSVAGQEIEPFESWLLPQLNKDVHRWRTINDDESRVMKAVKRAEQYFLLASLLGVVLAATAIAVAAARYCERHFDLVAIFKTLGGSSQQIHFIFSIQLILLAGFGIVVGLVLGYCAQLGILAALKEHLPNNVPQAGLRPWWLAVFTGVVSLALFSVYPLLKLFSIPPLRVLRRQMEGFSQKDWINWLISAIAVFCLMWVYSENFQLSLALLLSAGGITLFLLLIARSAIWGSRQAGANAGSAFKLALAGLYRRAQANSVQLISFTVAIQLLLVVLVLRNDLLAEWQNQLPEDTPNYFAVNINQQDLDKFKNAFNEKGILIEKTYPVTRGRLIAVNDVMVRDRVSKEDEKPADDAPRAIGRELNLTAGAELPEENEIEQGNWWQPDAKDYQVSIESGLAERMNLQLHDVLRFNAGGIDFTATITSIRKVKWESMKPNFFMIFNPVVLENHAATHIASFYVENTAKPELAKLLAQFPSVTLIDVDAIINQIREIINQVSLAVEFILILVVAAGVLVLIAQVQASMAERKQELVILRTLGSPSSLLRNSVTLEFVILGAIAGILAAIANEIALYVLQTEVFKMDASFHPEYWLVGIFTGACVVGTLGTISCWHLTRINTQRLLRSLA